MLTNVVVIFENYLPELIGALFVAHALFFFGQNDKLGKNHLVFASFAFLTLTFKDLFNLIILSDFTTLFHSSEANKIMPAVRAAASSLSAILMVVGGFEYSKTLGCVRKPIAYLFTMVIWYFLTY